MTASRLADSFRLSLLLIITSAASAFCGCELTPVDGDAAVDADGDQDADEPGDGGFCRHEPDPVERPALPDRPAEVDYLVIAANHLADAVAAHVEWRDERGHRSEVLTMSEVLDDGEGGVISDHSEAIERMRDVIRSRREALDEDRTMFVLLVGDTSAGWRGQPMEVPADELTGWSWEEADRVTSDNSIADLDGDHLPDVSIGRIPATQSRQVSSVLRRTRELEEGYVPGPWSYQVHVFASEGGFGEIIDEMIESAAFAAVRDVPREWQIGLTYARSGSPYAYPPALFSDRIYELLNGGSLLMAYIGHGWEEGFDSVSWEGETAPILDTDQLDNLEMTNRATLLVLIACLIGSFDSSNSLAEQFLHQDGGPTALLASTEISHPYANGVLIRELAETTLSQRLPTMGEVVLEAKRRMVTAADDVIRLEIDTYATIDPTSATPELRENLILAHQHMYTLFGDPAHRIDYPTGRASIELEAEEVVAGEEVRACVQIQGPPAGHAVVTLETDRETLARQLERWEMDDPDRDEVVVANNASANDKAIARWEGDYEEGGFFVSFPTSAEETGTLTIHVYAADEELDSLGSTTVEVLRPEP